tara:strand:+ start:7 stop:264 length:258 start_codon:yes stop_codon:yes gene_type:complete
MVLQELLLGIGIGEVLTIGIIIGCGILEVNIIIGEIIGHLGWVMYIMDMVIITAWVVIMDGVNRTRGTGVMDIMVETICMVEDLI